MKTKLYLLTIMSVLLFASCEDECLSRYGTLYAESDVVFAENTSTEIFTSLRVDYEKANIKWVRIEGITIIDDNHPEGYYIVNPETDNIVGDDSKLSPMIEYDYIEASVEETTGKDWSDFFVKVKLKENTESVRVLSIHLIGSVFDKDGSFFASGQFTIIQKGN